MKIWKRVIMGVVFSFMAFFIGIGYAALSDQLFISGTVSASTPKDIFITEIVPVGNAPAASISGRRQITIADDDGSGTITDGKRTITYAVTVYNNSGERKVCTGWTISSNVDSKVVTNSKIDADGNPAKPAIGSATSLGSNTEPYISGANLLTAEYKDPVTFYVTLELGTTPAGDIIIDYEFATFIYKIAFIHNEVERDAWYVYNAENKISIASSEGEVYANKELGKTLAEKVQADPAINPNNSIINFKYWMNAGSTMVVDIPAGNKKDIDLYPKFDPLYTAIFLETDGDIIDWTYITVDDSGVPDFSQVTKMAGDIETAGKIPQITDLRFNGWEVHETDADGNTTAEYMLDELSSKFGKTDIAIYPSYEYDGDVRLEPVDDNGDGETDRWNVIGYNNNTGSTLVRIPGEADGKPVETISSDAFSSYDDLHSAVIPGTVTTINSQAFTANNGTGRDTVTLYFEQDPNNDTKWQDAFEQYAVGNTDGILKQNWDNYMGDGSRVFFLDAYGKVDPSKGYWQLCNHRKVGSMWLTMYGSYKWVYHNHPYDSNDGCNLHHANVTDYDGKCTCNKDCCKDANGNMKLRPDADYWTWIVTYNPNNDIKETTSVNVVYGDPVILPAAPVDSEGRTFNGWYNAPFDGAKVGNAGDSYTPGADITLYAQWT